MKKEIIEADDGEEEIKTKELNESSMCRGDPSTCNCVIDISSLDNLERDFKRWLFCGQETSEPSSSSENDEQKYVKSESIPLPAWPVLPRVDGRKTKRAGLTPMNVFGRIYRPGLPLQMPDRKLIVDCSEVGMTVAQIARLLRISHGCVSKIVARFKASGQLSPLPYPKRRPRRSHRSLSVKEGEEDSSPSSSSSMRPKSS